MSELPVPRCNVTCVDSRGTSLLNDDTSLRVACTYMSLVIRIAMLPAILLLKLYSISGTPFTNLYDFRLSNSSQLGA